MSETIELITVNTEKEYHDCAMTFCLFYQHDESDFIVSNKQKYKIHTTIAEVKLLNEALHVYQEDNFKNSFLLYSNEIDGAKKYPDFVARFNRSQELAKQLTILANDEDSLVQLSEYCTQQAPTYNDDFGINKKIESITIKGKTKNLDGYEDIKNYLYDT